MPSCCSSLISSSQPKKTACPVNGKQYRGVAISTIMHHIKQPWSRHVKNQRYYFCEDPNCDVVYFADDNSVINQKDLRTVVGIKENKTHSMVCYCFGVTQSQTSDKMIKDFVIRKTKQKACACSTLNPSGHCCLKSFH